MRTLLVIVVLLMASASASQDADNMKAFPPAQKGMARHVLHLPRQTDESQFEVELIVGKTVQVDERNRYFFGGKIEEDTIKGWGFTRYTVTTLGQMAGTLIAVDPRAPRSASSSRLVAIRIWSATTAEFPLSSTYPDRKSVV